jgi:hypothetical protein
MKDIDEAFVQGLVQTLEEAPLPSGISSEGELERAICEVVREYTRQALAVGAEALHDIVFTHGQTRDEKERWTKSKPLQNVTVYGCSNTSDIFITHPRLGSVYVELKLSKRRGVNADTLPGDLQRSIGQSVIASLRHSWVICVVGCVGDRQTIPGDLGEKLRTMLWDKHRIALVVRGPVS